MSTKYVKDETRSSPEGLSSPMSLKAGAWRHLGHGSAMTHGSPTNVVSLMGRFPNWRHIVGAFVAFTQRVAAFRGYQTF